MLVALNTISSAAAGTPWPQLVAGSVVTALVATVAYIIRAIIKGDLVPRKTVEAETARADKWESSHDRSQERLDHFDGRMEAIEEGLRTVGKALTSVTDVQRERP